MRLQFTPAAERAMTTAGCWSLPGGDEIGPVGLLVGLAMEEECRAAEMLREHGVTISAIRERWPELTVLAEEAASPRFHSAALDDVLSTLIDRLSEFAPPDALATEHLLLGLTSARGEVRDWLADRGLKAEIVEKSIGPVNGFDTNPIDVEISSAPAPKEASVMETAFPVWPKEEGSELRAAMRILDAAGNRAREAARVLEDYARFVRNDAQGASELKNLRHDLAAAIGLLPVAERLAARDTPGDVGTRITNESEATRRSAGDVLAANFARLGESLRSLEEYSKLFDPKIAARFEGLRYRAYALESAVRFSKATLLDKPAVAHHFVQRDTRAQRLADARLYVLFDGGPTAELFEKSAAELIDAGVHVLQLRDKQLNDRELLDRARRLQRLTRDTQTLFVMNDRADIAVLAEADGLHVGQEELSATEARAIVGPNMLIGVSTHSIEQARRAVSDGADYIGLGPTFPSVTKTFAEFPGVAFLSAAARRVSVPAFAIGGIDLSNLDSVLATGINRVAVGRAITAAESPRDAVREFLERLG